MNPPGSIPLGVLGLTVTASAVSGNFSKRPSADDGRLQGRVGGTKTRRALGGCRAARGLVLSALLLAASPALAEASCAGSQISVFTRTVWIAETIVLSWGMESVCDVIEMGLLLGADPSRLAPVGEPIYGYRPAYQQTIAVAESGSYWIA